MARGQHQAFTFAIILSTAGGAGYVLKRHTPSLVAGMVLGVGFLGAALLVLTDTITEHHFEHGTSATMSSIIASVMGRRALITGLRSPAMIATLGAMSAGYHVQQLFNPPHKMRYIPGVTLEAGFGLAGVLLQKGEMTNGHGMALLVSSITMGAMGVRAMRTKKPLPVSIASLGAVSAAYHAQRFTAWVGQE
ncbi:hypothetical protein PsorP6_004065 [Peronosclerospora sorghi]|uniref:Uncharacterized protein n=1 Tax=Peronosclerospora sorghi TaxID=230839 RepID=A0ACC0VPT6_9STRA|nr:hypothetical protein PsorP6_004065 [Peronosclerospora sorghi]